MTGTGPIASWWPGAQYVTWVGIDGYYYRPSDTFASVFGKTINQVRAFTSKPVLLSETAVGPDADQFVKIRTCSAGCAVRTLGLVWFDKDQQGDDGTYHQDWRIEDRRPPDLGCQRSGGTATSLPPCLIAGSKPYGTRRSRSSGSSLESTSTTASSWTSRRAAKKRPWNVSGPHRRASASLTATTRVPFPRAGGRRPRRGQRTGRPAARGGDGVGGQRR
jgi:hypothetical protein